MVDLERNKCKKQMKVRQAGSIYYLLIINGDDYCHLDLHSMFEFIPPWFSWLGAACLDQACGRAASPGGPGGPGGSGGNGGDGGGAGDLLQIYPTGLSSLFCTEGSLAIKYSICSCRTVSTSGNEKLVDGTHLKQNAKSVGDRDGDGHDKHQVVDDEHLVREATWREASL